MNKEIQSDIGWDELFLRHVYLIARKSKDPRTRIGAILVKDGTIISEGYNGFPRGVKDYHIRYNDRALKLMYVVHAESNAVLNAVRHGISTKDSHCYTQAMPCCDCAKNLIQAGITQLILHRQWAMSPTWTTSAEIGREMLTEAGITIRYIDQKLGLTVRSDGKDQRI